MEDILVAGFKQKKEDRAKFMAPSLKKVDDYIATNGKNGCVIGDKISMADVFVGCYICNMCSGLMDGVDDSMLKDFKNILAVTKNLCSQDKVKAYLKEKDAKS